LINYLGAGEPINEVVEMELGKAIFRRYELPARKPSAQLA